jgi:NAD(P)-dependent dehydrogenase (short-subunit alcohol dehydrogenase family)
VAESVVSSSAASLAGLSVIITGAGRGLGRAMALACGHAGAEIIAVDIDEVLLGETMALLDDHDVTAAHHRCDVSNEHSVRAFFAQLDAPPWAVINNAALADGVGGLPFWEIESADWERVLRVNLDGTWLFSKHAALAMIPEARGRIINLASDAAIYGSPRLGHYIASKGAVMALTRGMARELGPHNITVNGVAPGLTEGPSAERIPQERHQLYADNRALNRPQTADDLTGIVTFLVSEQSAYITGQTIVVDGGFVMP